MYFLEIRQKSVGSLLGPFDGTNIFSQQLCMRGKQFCSRL